MATNVEFRLGRFVAYNLTPSTIDYLELIVRADMPGIYEFGSAEGQTFETCETCLRIGKNCDPGLQCESYYVATSGSVELTKSNQTEGIMKGALLGVELKEVDSDFNVPILNADPLCISRLEFDATPPCRFDDDCRVPGKPYCYESICGECVSSFHCTDPAAPGCIVDVDLGMLVCGTTMECNGDDGNEEDDGPAAAKPLISGTPFSGGICRGTLGETDWFTFTTAQTVNASITFGSDANVNVYLVSEFQVIFTESSQLGPITTNNNLAPGRYYVIVEAVDTSAFGGGFDAVPYSLSYTATATP